MASFLLLWASSKSLNAVSSEESRRRWESEPWAKMFSVVCHRTRGTGRKESSERGGAVERLPRHDRHQWTL